MRTLIVFYSLSGTTKAVAETLAGMLGADITEIRCRRYRSGLFGFLRAGHDSMRGRLPPVELPPALSQTYDLIVIGTPIWAGHAATPVRAFLSGRPRLPDKVALFITRGGSSPETALAEMEALLPAPSVAKLALKSDDVKKTAGSEALCAFAAALAG